MGRLAQAPVSREDRLLVPEDAASHLLKLAAQVALEVRVTRENCGCNHALATTLQSLKSNLIIQICAHW